MSNLTDKEVDQAADAMVEWFKSQDLDPVQGTRVMIRQLVYQLLAVAMRSEHPVDCMGGKLRDFHDIMAKDAAKMLMQLIKEATERK